MNLLELLGRGGPVMLPIFAVSLLIWWFGLKLWFELAPADRDRAGLAKSGNTSRNASRNTVKVLKTLTSTAPYLGLLGTVGGMMMAFEGLLRFGPGNLRGLSDGIARALVTTQAGLLVALTGMLFLVFLEGRIRKTEAGIESGRLRRRRRRWRHG